MQQQSQIGSSSLSTFGTKKRTAPSYRTKQTPSRAQATPASKRSPSKKTPAPRAQDTVGYIPVTHSFRSPVSSAQSSFIVDHSTSGPLPRPSPALSASDRKRTNTTLHSFICEFCLTSAGRAPPKAEASPQLRSQPATPFKSAMKGSGGLQVNPIRNSNNSGGAISISETSSSSGGALNQQNPAKLLLESKLTDTSVALAKLSEEFKRLRASHGEEISSMKEKMKILEQELCRSKEQTHSLAHELASRFGKAFKPKDIEERLSRLEVWRNICIRQQRFGGTAREVGKGSSSQGLRVGLVGGEKTTPKNGERESTLLFTSPNELDRTVAYKFTPDSPHNLSIDAPYLVQRLESALNPRNNHPACHQSSPLSLFRQLAFNFREKENQEQQASPHSNLSPEVFRSEPHIQSEPMSAHQPASAYQSQVSRLLSPEMKPIEPFNATHSTPARRLRVSLKPSQPSEAHLGASPISHSATPGKADYSMTSQSSPIPSPAPPMANHPAVFALAQESPLTSSASPLRSSSKHESPPFSGSKRSSVPHQVIDLVISPLSPIEQTTPLSTNKALALQKPSPQIQELFSPITPSADVVANTKTLAIDLKRSTKLELDSPTPADEAGDMDNGRPSLPSHRSVPLTSRDSNSASEQMRHTPHEPKLMVALNSRSTSRSHPHRSLRLTHSESFTLEPTPQLDLRRIRPDNTSFTSSVLATGGPSSSRSSDVRRRLTDAFSHEFSVPSRPTYSQFLAQAPPEGHTVTRIASFLSNDQKHDSSSSQRSRERPSLPRVRTQSDPVALEEQVRGSMTLEELESGLPPVSEPSHSSICRPSLSDHTPKPLQSSTIWAGDESISKELLRAPESSLLEEQKCNSPSHSGCSSELHQSVSRLQSPLIDEQHRTTIHPSVLRGPILCSRASISASENLNEGDEEEQSAAPGEATLPPNNRRLPLLKTLEDPLNDSSSAKKNLQRGKLLLDTSNSAQSLATQPAGATTLFSPSGGFFTRLPHHAHIQCNCPPIFPAASSRREADCDSSIELLSDNHFFDNESKTGEPSPLPSPARSTPQVTALASAHLNFASLKLSLPLSAKPCSDFCHNLPPARQKELITFLRAQQANESRAFSGAGGHPQAKRFLVSAAWWRRWKDYVDFDGPSQDTTSSVERTGFKTTSSVSDVIREVNRELASQEASLQVDRSDHQGYEAMLAGLKAQKIQHEANMMNQMIRLHDHPGPISNAQVSISKFSEILRPGQSMYLRAPLLEHYDFQVVSPAEWRLLNSWYGCDWSVTRFLVRDRTNPSKFILDLYPSAQSSLLTQLAGNGIPPNRLNRTSSLAAFTRK